MSQGGGEEQERAQASNPSRGPRRIPASSHLDFLLPVVTLHRITAWYDVNRWRPASGDVFKALQEGARQQSWIGSSQIDNLQKYERRLLRGGFMLNQQFGRRSKAMSSGILRYYVTFRPLPSPLPGRSDGTRWIVLGVVPWPCAFAITCRRGSSDWSVNPIIGSEPGTGAIGHIRAPVSATPVRR